MATLLNFMGATDQQPDWGQTSTHVYTLNLKAYFGGEEDSSHKLKRKRKNKKNVSLSENPSGELSNQKKIK